MKPLIALLVALWMLLGLAGDVSAACTTQRIFLPDGRLLVCLTCCSESSCSTVCN